MKLLEEQLQEIMKCFEWEKVQKAMIALNWKWVIFDAPSVGFAVKIPSVDQIQAEAISLLTTAYDGATDRDYPVSCGGLRAICAVHNGRKYLRLSFEVDSWDIEELDADDEEPLTQHRLDISTVENRNIQPTL